MKQFSQVVERANREVFNPAGLNMLDPKRTGYLFVRNSASQTEPRSGQQLG